MKCYLIHNTDTVGVSSWYIEEAYRRTNYDNFKRLKPDKVMKQIAENKLSPPDYFLVWEGNVSDPYCTRDLAYIKIPKIMWFSDSYPVPGYMDYFSFEVFWAMNTKPDIILMAQRGKIEDMKKATGIDRVYWMPFAGEPLYHQEIVKNPEYDISYVGTINPNDNHPDQIKARYLSLLSKAGFKVRATISHGAGRPDYASEWKLGRPVLSEYSKEITMGKVGFNCNIAGDLTMRTFEIPFMNRPLLSNGGDSWDKIFEDDVNIVIYNKDNIIYQMKRLIEDDGFRKRVAENMREDLLKSHTYEARIKQIEMLVENDIDGYENSLYR